ncbi:MAG: hypothetical protein SGARI_002955, partial [Bacillariaceae sp.]
MRSCARRGETIIRYCCRHQGNACGVSRLFSSSTLSQQQSKQYSVAIARQVPQSFANAITKFADPSSKVDLQNAIRQHDIYLERLRKFVPTVCLPAVSELADSVFVEDTVVAVGNRAVITNPGHPSRRGEVDSIREVLSQQLGMEVTDMRDFQNAF